MQFPHHLQEVSDFQFIDCTQTLVDFDYNTNYYLQLVIMLCFFHILCVQYIEYGQQSRDPPVKMQGSITTPGSLALAQVQAQAQPQPPGAPKVPQPGQTSTLVTTTTTTTTVAKTATITRPTSSSFKKDVPVCCALDMHVFHAFARLTMHPCLSALYKYYQY